MSCSPQEITLRIGQGVPWRTSRTGFAQIDELRRVNVRVVYVTARGKARFRTLAAKRVAELMHNTPLMFDLDNPFNRGVRPRSKTYMLTEAAK